MSFVPRLPRPGQVFVSMKRAQILGTVTSVGDDRRARFRCIRTGAIRSTALEWEALQEAPQEYRFLPADEVPESFTPAGNGWAPWDGPCSSCGEPAELLDRVTRDRVCSSCFSELELARHRAFLERAGGEGRPIRRRRRR